MKLVTLLLATMEVALEVYRLSKSKDTRMVSSVDAPHYGNETSMDTTVRKSLRRRKRCDQIVTQSLG